MPRDRLPEGVTIRPTTPEDVAGFFGRSLQPTIRAWTAFYRGEAACIAGISLGEHGFVAFSDVKPGIDAPKMTVWRTVRALMKLIASTGVPVYSSPNVHLCGAPKLLEILGFTDTGKMQDGMKIYRREAT